MHDADEPPEFRLILSERCLRLTKQCAGTSPCTSNEGPPAVNINIGNVTINNFGGEPPRKERPVIGVIMSLVLNLAAAWLAGPLGHLLVSVWHSVLG